MARILAVDYGEKRTGLAVTDSLQIIVSPLDGIATADLNSYLTKYFQEEEVEEFVIGYPKHKDGTKTYLCAAIDKLLVDLSKSYPDLKISKTDESFSSSEGAQLMRQALKKKKRQQKGQLDMYSAVVILRRYLGHH